MKLVRGTLVKRDVCGCGFGLVHEHVPDGKTYNVDWDSQESGTLICGGCGKRTEVTLIKSYDVIGDEKHLRGTFVVEALKIENEQVLLQ